jgi:hypothetical protein
MTTLATLSLGYAAELIVDDTSVYWAAAAAGSGDYPDTILKLTPK